MAQEGWEGFFFLNPSLLQIPGEEAFFFLGRFFSVQITSLAFRCLEV